MDLQRPRNPTHPLIEASCAKRRADEKARKRASPKGRLIEEATVWKPQADALRDLLDQRLWSWSGGHLHHLVHVLICQLAPPLEEAGVPVSHKLIDPISPTGSSADVVNPLVDGDLMTFEEANRFKRRSREFRVTQEVIDAFLDAAPQTAAEAAGSSYWKLLANKKTTAVQRTTLNDAQRNPYPETVRRGLAAVRRGLLFAPVVEAHLADLQAQAETAQQLWEAAGRPERNDPDPTRRASRIHLDRLRGRYQSDRRCYNVVLRQNIEATELEGVYSYVTAYRPQSTGRIGFVGGGLQSASRRMKQAAYGWLPNVYNYDLRAAHPNLLIELLEEADLDPSWLENYVADPDAKHHCARAAGVEVDVWKQVLNGHLNGANIPTSLHEDYVDGEVARLIREHVREDDQYATLAEIRDLLRDLTGQLEAWHDYLETTYIECHGQLGRGGAYVKNDAGVPFYYAEIEEQHERRARLAAHMLQGREAAFVHTLASLGPEYGFEPIAHEHDGLVTVGKIPREANEQAKAMTGIRRATLVVKPFCNDTEQAALLKACRRRGVRFPAGSAAAK